MTTSATLERQRLASLMLELGPDAPTRCDGWTARDLAAHIVLRERRPDAAVGVVFGRFAGRTAAVQAKIADGDWKELVAKLRNGPPIWSPTRIGAIDRAFNTLEFFVHHEDLRRATEQWRPRELDDDLADDLDAALRRGARLLARRARCGVTLEPDAGRARITARDADPTVIVRGPLGELVLWMFGRDADVEFDGPDDAVEALRAARLGV
ncbi:MAG: TIGR03085 family metal-binding protein [Ilumatobacter sp.]|uniref:TIGR03085 family metal-binding protein n=1 Tax=Ilumatobacter sp. TaxID=1967498 RepID=UPI00261D49DB|nr:TIGR03085 family metal-binding protein [Ilumatobacter sp.]MDJ0771083.1 TIGR03085 family metal-binding protein [Ilumatobacter sp.]